MYSSLSKTSITGPFSLHAGNIFLSHLHETQAIVFLHFSISEHFLLQSILKSLVLCSDRYIYCTRHHRRTMLGWLDFLWFFVKKHGCFWFFFFFVILQWRFGILLNFLLKFYRLIINALLVFTINIVQISIIRSIQTHTFASIIIVIMFSRRGV